MVLGLALVPTAVPAERPTRLVVAAELGERNG